MLSQDWGLTTSSRSVCKLWWQYLYNALLYNTYVHYQGTFGYMHASKCTVMVLASALCAVHTTEKTGLEAKHSSQVSGREPITLCHL